MMPLVWAKKKGRRKERKEVGKDRVRDGKMEDRKGGRDRHTYREF